VHASDTVRVAENGLVLACSQPGPGSMRCDYRVGNEAEVLGVSARIGEIDLPAPQFAAQASDSGPVAVVIVVEETLLGDATSREQIVTAVQRLVSSAGERFRFGLAGFSDSLRVMATPGSGVQALVQRLIEPQVTSSQILLFRSLGEAVGLLAGNPAPRKALLLLASGDSQDQQIDHAAVAREARVRDIPVYTVALASATESGIRRLRQLSLDTGGHHVRARSDGSLADDYYSAPFAGLDNAGALSLDFTAAARRLGRGEYLLRIELDTASGSINASVPLFLAGNGGDGTAPSVIPARVESSAPTPPGARPLPRSPAPGVSPRPIPQQRTPLLVWLLGGVAIALLAAVTVLGLLIVRRHRSTRRSDTVHSQRVRHHGPGVPHLVLTDGLSGAQAITASPFKIGRLGNNDLVLSDPSVSRHHAEIVLGQDGTCTIRDLESMNGVYVNNRKVRERVLRDRDELEVGDVRLGFELRYEDMPAERTSAAVASGVDPLEDTGPGHDITRS
jgi:hypothetical protein